MSANPDIGNGLRAPRCIVNFGPWGQQVTMPGWVSVEVVNNNLTSADTFRVVFATNLLPKGFGPDWFAKQQDAYVEIFFGFPADPSNVDQSELKSFIFGQVDRIDWEPSTASIELEGRDLTRVFIDTRSTQKYQQLKASQIATNLATAHGLTPQVTETKTLAGKFYEIDHVNLQDERSDWELLVYLANSENFVTYVRGKTLYFGPRPDASQDPYSIRWVNPTAQNGSPQANVQTLHFSRALTVSRGIQVVVRSWNSRQSKGFDAYFPSRGKAVQIGKATPFGNSQVYRRTYPNLTQEAADKKAKEIYEGIVAHEMRLEAELPGDVILDTSSVIEVTGTETAFDQRYYVDAITRRLDFEDGFTMSVRAKNSAPESQAVL